MAYSNQRITKIKKDPILSLLERAEATYVEDACVVVPAVDSLTPYPNPEQTRTWIRDNLLKGVNAIIPINGLAPFNVSGNHDYQSQAIQYTTIIDGLPLNTYSHKLLDSLDTTTYNYKMAVKPGLMLSNLCCPMSWDAGGGSFVRQAQCSDTECKDFTELYHGHYGYTYLQRGIYHRVAGSTHSDNDSYMLHWSPMPNSSTTYEGMLIPGTQFKNSYTNYMTICMPSDVNMKTYSITSVKEVQFLHVDNNTDNTISTTTYNGRLVGDGWSYEITASGNQQGSGSNWGETPSTGANSSNGVCVNGEIVYVDSFGTECHQLIVDWCAQTIDADNNVNNPNAYHGYATGNNIQGPGQEIDTYSDKTWSKALANFGEGALSGGLTRIRDCSDSLIYEADLGRYDYINAGYVYFGYPLPDWPTSVQDYETCSCRLRFQAVSNGFDGGHLMANNSGGSPEDGCFQFDTSLSNGYRYLSGVSMKRLNSLQRTINITVCPDKDDCFVTEDFSIIPHANISVSNLRFFKKGTSNKNVNIYLNIVDNKKQMEDMGMTWNVACDQVDRFSYTLSSTPCEESWCSSKLLYENVTITPDGDFAEGLQNVTIKS